MKIIYAPNDRELEYEANTESELAEKLRKYICRDCLIEAGLENHRGSLEELLSTACGCEWWFEN